jgi:hypothetical protein
MEGEGVSLSLTIENRLHALRVQGEVLLNAGGHLMDLCEVEAFDYDDISELLAEVETAIGQIRVNAVVLRSLKVEQKESEGEPVGRKREETA